MQANDRSPGEIAVLFRHQDTAEQAVLDLRAAGFAPRIYALPGVEDLPWVDSDLIVGEPGALEGLAPRLLEAGLSEQRVRYFTDGVRDNKILIVVAAGERSEAVFAILKPRGGDYGSGGPEGSNDPQAGSAFSFEDGADSSDPEMRASGIWSRGSH
ncbi:hypothetical protein [Gloeobacter violaceus]|nr:hypothetical protein [Gloeobacter violaceus]